MTSAIRDKTHNTIAVLVAFFALSVSHQVSGRMPLTKKVTTPARLMQMMFVSTIARQRWYYTLS